MIPADDRAWLAGFTLVIALLGAIVASIAITADRNAAREHRERMACLRARGEWIEEQYTDAACRFARSP